MKRRASSGDLLVVLILAGIAGLWFFGRTQPIEVITTSHAGVRDESCATCGGRGSVEAMVPCDACDGTGKGIWRLKGRTTTDDSRRPACMTCQGTGRVKGRVPCDACQGAGHATSRTTRDMVTVRAGLSLWERILSYLFIAPATNPAPQINARGGCDLVERYAEQQARGARVRVTGLGAWQLVGSEWRNTAFIEYAEKAGRIESRKVEFVVRNRELVAMHAKS